VPPVHKWIRSLEEVPDALRAGAVSVGNFDGVHRGHAMLVARLVARAREVGGPAVIFTFDPHPARLLSPNTIPPPLTWTERKVELLTRLGVDAVIAYRTDRALLALAPEAFFRQLLRAQLDARAIVEGPNFRFGRDRSGSIDDLARMCRADDVTLEVVEPLTIDERYVSSSWIRELIQAGEVGHADRLLTRPYRVRGRVVRGAGRGGAIGFPTANIEPVDMVLPPLGVYAGSARVAGRWFAAALHIGPNPTFGEHERVKFEAHLVGYHQSLYGAILEVDFLDRLRDIRLFETIEELQAQLTRDVRAAHELARASRCPNRLVDDDA
jgi:riboflavin kinase / FMN adenylyltransferase